MTNKVFSVSGTKISSLIIDEHSLKFSSNSFVSVAEFQVAWDKKLSLATKVEVKYENIKSIKKEENDEDITIKYKALAGIPSDCEFSFPNAGDYEAFFDFFEKQLAYKKTFAQLSPFKAIRNYLIGLAITIGFTAFAYFEAVGLADGTVEEASSRKSRAFQNIVSMLGDKGVLAIGVAIGAFIVYKVWTRFKNPPNQINLIPPNV